ncbi:MAG: winged helix-turn-helix domain-containing protein [Alphaproteobacteria bacterium]|nr:winged helix-turn-helix domain-containing protein [Alphaproteobacteria bacterium]
MLSAPPSPAPASERRYELRVATGLIDFIRQRFHRDDGRAVRLTPLEAELLGRLARVDSAPVSREDLLVDVWGHHSLSLSRALDNTVARLRRKLERTPAAPDVLLTVHGTGYRLVTRAPGAAPPARTPIPRRPLRLGDRVVDLASGQVETPGGTVELTNRERLVLEQLAQARGAVVSADKLARLAGIEGRRGALSNTIHRLRAKLEADPGAPGFVLSVRGAGYRLDAQLVEPPPRHEELVAAMRSLTDHIGLVLGIEDCVVYLRDGDALVQVAACGVKRAPDGGVRAPMTQRLGEGLVGCAAAARDTLRVADVRADPRYLPDLVPGRSELAVPILRHGEVMGVIDSEAATPDAFTTRHARVFLSLATFASAAFAPPLGAPHG